MTEERSTCQDVCRETALVPGIFRTTDWHGAGGGPACHRGIYILQGYLIIEQVVLPLLEQLPCCLVGKVLSVVNSSWPTLRGATSPAFSCRPGLARRSGVVRVGLLGFGFTIVRGIVLQCLEEDGVTFRPILVDLQTLRSRSIGFEVEDFDEESVVVFLPTIPTITLGTVEIVPKDRIEVLPASMHVALGPLSQFDSDASKLHPTAEALSRTRPGGSLWS